jgi:phosphotriesterase-related protein
MSKKVMTVLGEISTDELGQTLMHEHICASAPGIPENYPQLYIENAEGIILGDLADMKGEGFKTVIEATLFDLGRDIRMLKRVSEKSGIHIVASTGFFQEPSPVLGSYSVDKFAALFVDDLTKGIAGTDIKAGIIKTAMDAEGATPGRTLIHRAVARAAMGTGAKVMLHSYPQTEMGRNQVKILKNEGLDLKNVKIDHILETTDMDYIKWLADQGVWLGVDRLPLIIDNKHYGVANETRIKTIYNMIKAGLHDRMLLSHDISSVSTMFDHLDKENTAFVENINRERFGFLTRRAFPKLIEMGIDKTLLYRMLTDNPKRFFEA